MRWLPAILIDVLFATFLTGCSVHPLPDDVTRLSTYDIVQQIRCEAARAAKDRAPQYKDGFIAYEFEFHITEDNRAKADATFKIPYMSGEMFSLKLDGNVEKNRDAVRNFRIVDRLNSKATADCFNGTLRRNLIYPIAGDIGIYEVVATFVKLQRAEHPQAGETFTFTDELTFMTRVEGGISPHITLAPAHQFQLVSANATLTSSRLDIHKVTVSLTAGPALSPPPPPLRDESGRIMRRAAPPPRVAPLGARVTAFNLRNSPGASNVQPTNNALLSTTIIQTQVTPEERALLELDRRRLLTLQQRATNNIVGP
jgi:hypothetical protein